MKSKVIKAVILTMISVAVAIGLFNILKNEIFNTKIASLSATETQASTSSNIGTIVAGQSNPSTYGYRSSAGSFWEARHKNSMPLPLPTLPGYQIYCTEHGIDSEFNPSAPGYKEILATNGKSAYGDACPTLSPVEGTVSTIGYSASGSGTLPAVAAYIISGNPEGGWTADKQRGLWNLSKYTNGLVIIAGHSANDGASSYDTEALNYMYYDKEVRGKGLQPKDQTLKAEDISGTPTEEQLKKVVRVNVNKATGEYTVGPFKVDYKNGIYGKVAFAGISNMEVIGYNTQGTVVNDSIKVEKIVLVDTATGQKQPAKGPDYFTPGTDKVDRTDYVYPKPNQEFYIVYKDPNAGLAANDTNKVSGISLRVKFQYMLADGKYTKYNGTMLQVNHNHFHVVTEAGEECLREIYLSKVHKQNQMCADAIRTIYEQEIIIGGGDDGSGGPDGPVTPIPEVMELGGHVWEDGVATKESKADGFSNTGEGIDIPLKNVKVTLYTEDGNIATLMTDPNESGVDDVELMHRINPTYTDEEGNYLFRGLDPMQKYYVKFDYNGQTYLPTEYCAGSGSVQAMVNAGLYNTDSWEVTSKGTELESDRTAFDQKFEEIGSYPENYTSSNSLGQVGAKNAAFSQLDLMGYTLDSSGKYQYNSGSQLVDGFKFDENGLKTDEFAEGIISKKVREYISANKKFPDENEMKGIYSSIASDAETWKKLQFIEDCYINAYTCSPSGQMDYYPVYDKFKINKEIGGTYDMSSDIIDGIEYKPIYPGQYYVNLGLWRRQEYDIALRKDVYRAAIKINDKTVVYKYNERGSQQEEDGTGTNSADGKDNNTYWDINVRVSDASYYGAKYERELYESDYNFGTALATNHPGDPLEVYVTYKITVRNQSMSILAQIQEIVDYYDQDYEYKDNLSWIQYKSAVSDDEYYSLMSNKQSAMDDSVKATSYMKKSPSTAAQGSASTKYSSATESDLKSSYGAVYVTGLKDKKLASGESAYVYLTFQVKKVNNKIITDDGDEVKQNLVEINGYKTYYKDGTALPNGVTKGSGDIAGLLDRDSNPGNLVKADLEGENYQKNFEDDTDEAVGLRIFVNSDSAREVNGTVWEDERDTAEQDSMIGNGINDDSTKVAGVTVQFVEKYTDNSGKITEYVWGETKTDSSGAYNFRGYIPGEYVVRFYYGDTVATAETTDNGGSNIVSYNGQDFKSTLYQINMSQSGIEGNNTTGSYKYNIYESDASGSNLSDAKDLWTKTNTAVGTVIIKNGLETVSSGVISATKTEIQGRQEVNNYSNNNGNGVTNHLAEVLASPYETPTYNGTTYPEERKQFVENELIPNTYMTAETGVITVEIEYDRQQSEGPGISNGADKYLYGNDVDGKFVLNNIDLGLTERPKAQLEIDKSISNIKVTLANGNILFDVNSAGDNVIWKDHVEYNLAKYKDSNGKYEEYYGNSSKNRYSYREKVNNIVAKTDRGLIQITMDEEIMHGSTIEITYKLKVTNVGEVDYEGEKFYYLGDSSGANKVKTIANQVVDYVNNNLKFDSTNVQNSGWSVIQKDALTSGGLVNNKLATQVNQFNYVIQTEGLNSALEPGQSTEDKPLVLTQTITSENTSDDLTYSNIVEIVKTSNTVGRRMAYSVVGNQDPTLSTASEVDASLAERVIILPPFGNIHIYYILGAVIGIILIGGIAFIIRKVLKK